MLQFTRGIQMQKALNWLCKYWYHFSLFDILRKLWLTCDKSSFWFDFVIRRELDDTSFSVFLSFPDWYCSFITVPLVMWRRFYLCCIEYSVFNCNCNVIYITYIYIYIWSCSPSPFSKVKKYYWMISWRLNFLIKVSINACQEKCS